MFLINCPYCGPREQAEFRCGGEAHIVRPGSPDTMTDAEWRDYVFNRKNPKGVHAERWRHAHGCGKWFNIVRDTATDEILAIYKATEPMPDVQAATLTTPSGEPVIGSGHKALDQRDFSKSPS